MSQAKNKPVIAEIITHDDEPDKLSFVITGNLPKRIHVTALGAAYGEKRSEDEFVPYVPPLPHARAMRPFVSKHGTARMTDSFELRVCSNCLETIPYALYDSAFREPTGVSNFCPKCGIPLSGKLPSHARPRWEPRVAPGEHAVKPVPAYNAW